MNKAITTKGGTPGTELFEQKLLPDLAVISRDLIAGDIVKTGKPTLIDDEINDHRGPQAAEVSSRARATM